MVCETLTPMVQWITKMVLAKFGRLSGRQKGWVLESGMFMWKINYAGGGTSGSHASHKNTSNRSKVYSLWGGGWNTGAHALSLSSCEIGMVCLTSSPVPIRTDRLEGQTAKDMLTRLWKDLQSDQVCLSMKFIWAIWKSRCGHIFQGKRQSPDNISNSAMTLMKNSQRSLLLKSLPNSTSATLQLFQHPIHA